MDARKAERASEGGRERRGRARKRESTTYLRKEANPKKLL